MKVDKLIINSIDYTDTGGGQRTSEPKVDAFGELIKERQTFTGLFFSGFFIEVTIVYNRLKIEYSPCTYLSGGTHNTAPATLTDVKAQVLGILTELDKQGVHATLESFEVKQIDIALDRVMKSPFKEYKQALKGLQFNSTRSNEYGTTLTKSNESSTILFYDKVKQLKKHKREIPKEYVGKNIMRCEYRLQKKPKVRAVCGSAKLLDVLASQSKLETAFLKTLKAGMYL